jgi:hypothetical protein
MVAFYRVYPSLGGFSPPAVARLLPQGKVPPVVAKSSARIVQGAVPPENPIRLATAVVLVT